MDSGDDGMCPQIFTVEKCELNNLLPLQTYNAHIMYQAIFCKQISTSYSRKYLLSQWAVFNPLICFSSL